ncbi:hypothetical protein F5879DRAFT_903154 [Lentinula edodes]|nr:hypothetical protein F5879DRAFT_903154 [Lentinula edodes]
MSSTPSKYKETSSRCPFPGEATECEAANDKSQPQSLNPHARSRSKKTFNPQLILENNGSVARDHLASERTFLAYVRTSLAIASTGVALVQLLTISVDASTNGSTTSLTTEPTSQRMQAYAKPLGSAFVIFSIILFQLGLTRYFSIQNALTLNQFPAARLVIIISSLILGALVIFTFAILVAGQS